VRRLGTNAYGERLQPGRVADCSLGILLEQPLAELAPEPGRVLLVAPAALLHEEIPQPDGQVLYDLLTGHPDRAARELVFLADLTVELRAWPQQTWTAVGVSPDAALLAIVDCWRGGHVKGLEFDGVVVVEPARIVAESPQGLRALYVALTRATQRLTVVHADPLPVGLGGVAAPPAG